MEVLYAVLSWVWTMVMVILIAFVSYQKGRTKGIEEARELFLPGEVDPPDRENS